jgi:pimeloyl-ACP methyl ester carboxylesterase
LRETGPPCAPRTTWPKLYCNVGLYPTFQKYFRTYKPPFLAVWGKNDPFFLPKGAEAFKRDIPHAVVSFFDTGHFALETHATGIAAAIRKFLPH